MPGTARMCSVEKLFVSPQRQPGLFYCVDPHRAILGLRVGSAPGICRRESNTHFRDSRNEGSCTLTALYRELQRSSP